MPEPTREQEYAIGGLARHYQHVMVEHLPPRGAMLILVRCYDEGWREQAAVFVYPAGMAKYATPADLAVRGQPPTYKPTPEEKGEVAV